MRILSNKETQTEVPKSLDTPKKIYSIPKLVVYGDAGQITRKTYSLQDHNQGSNGMGS